MGSEQKILELLQNNSDKFTVTDPAENPTLTLDCFGRNTAEFWVLEPTGDITVNIYGSLDGSTWRQTTNYTTDIGGNVTDVMSIGYRYIQVEIVNTNAGDYMIEISASR